MSNLARVSSSALMKNEVLALITHCKDYDFLFDLGLV